ncbi:TerB family tellurite resistance protein [Flavisolibacter tropicus]|uniref:Co-chaperone DjlA N-terminal domain-containing protein n=1 Tax=Flavisolibacter tropicus TaxID=1492898 RepID=A0A172U0J2_9BACT|nr:TerB family tellurite resistance protein [Flavisolibacter tropicus]ANE52776.1 hypothetical protein SY85_22150 [Flavisolibacter tropicus]
MEQGTPTILEGYSDMEKGAYLGAIASLATADRSATEEELAYIEALCEGAELSEEQKGLIQKAAMEPMADDDLKRCLDVLKNSDLRFSLVSDLIAFAGADQNYSEEEKQNVEKVANYLGVNQQQFSLLDQFTKKAVQEAPAQAQALQDGATQPQNFLGGLGFGDKLKNAGINTNGLLKGALAVMGPIILAQLFRGGRRGGGMMGGGSTGGGLGGMMGGGLLGGLLAGGGRGMGGGLFDMLGGGRGFGNAGGMLGRILGGGRF